MSTYGSIFDGLKSKMDSLKPRRRPMTQKLMTRSCGYSWSSPAIRNSSHVPMWLMCGKFFQSIPWLTNEPRLWVSMPAFCVWRRLTTLLGGLGKNKGKMKSFPKNQGEKLYINIFSLKSYNMYTENLSKRNFTGVYIQLQKPFAVTERNVSNRTHNIREVGNPWNMASSKFSGDSWMYPYPTNVHPYISPI